MTPLTFLGPFGIGGAEMGIIAFVVLIGLGALVLQIFYLLMLQNTLKLVSPDLQKMSPGLVWLVLIPLFGLVWNFIMVGNIADSLRSEFMRRNIRTDEERPGYSVGLAMCILPLIGFVPFIGIIGSLGGLVCWIIYWTRIKRYKEMLEQSSPYQQFQQHSYQYNPNQHPNQGNPYQNNPYQNPNQNNPYQNPNQNNPYQNPNQGNPYQNNPNTNDQNPGNIPPPYQP